MKNATLMPKSKNGNRISFHLFSALRSNLTTPGERWLRYSKSGTGKVKNMSNEFVLKLRNKSSAASTGGAVDHQPCSKKQCMADHVRKVDCGDPGHIEWQQQEQQNDAPAQMFSEFAISLEDGIKEYTADAHQDKSERLVAP